MKISSCSAPALVVVALLSLAGVYGFAQSSSNNPVLASPIAFGTNTVVLFNTTASDLSGSLTLHAPATNTVYLLNGFVPSSTHFANVTTVSGQHTIQIGTGSGLTASAVGALHFRVDTAGNVTQL